jgi:hypothetical protein
MKKVLSIVCLCFSIFTLKAQTSELRSTLVELRMEALNAPTNNSLQNQTIQETVIDMLNNGFILDDTLAYEAALSWLVSEKNDVALVTWHQPIEGGFNNYWGVVAHRDNKKDEWIITLLTDTSLEPIENKFTEYFDTENWAGAVYYKMIPFKREGGSSIALFGWRGEDLLVSTKLIEVLTFKRKRLTFGLPVFQTKSSNIINRVLLHYPSNAIYNLKYIEDKDAFVYNRLTLANKKLDGSYAQYEPTFIFDGFFYEKGKWIFKEDFDLRAPEKKKK